MFAATLRQGAPMRTDVPVLGFLVIVFGGSDAFQTFGAALLHPLVGFLSLLSAFLVDMVGSIGLMPVTLSPSRDTLVHGVEVISAAALGRVRFSVQHVDGDVVRSVLLRGVVTDGAIVGRVPAQGEFQRTDHSLVDFLLICLALLMNLDTGMSPIISLMSAFSYAVSIGRVRSLSIRSAS